jgi:hypothetical protein
MATKAGGIQVAWRAVARSNSVRGIVLAATGLAVQRLGLTGMIDDDLARTLANDLVAWLEPAGMALMAWGRMHAQGPLVRRKPKAG